jgi:3-oxoacyl-[acyl-carrier protein] reductase
MSSFDLSGRVALVTGGSRGLGRETVLAFARAGADVLITSRHLESCEALAEEVTRETGRRAVPYACHVGRWDELDGLVDAAYDAFGRVDVLVNNAGTGTYKPFLEVTDEELVHGMEINFFAQFRLTQRIAPMMIANGGGVVINVAGATGVRVTKPPFRSSCTGPAKAAEVRLSKVLASELGEHGIRVNCVVPGLVYTEDRFAKWEREMAGREPDVDLAAATQQEWGSDIPRPGHEWGTVAEIADLIVFAASERSTYLNGATLVIDGGEDKS